MQAPITSIDSTTGGVKINWVIPDARGSPITAFRVQILNLLNSWVDKLNDCDGSSATVITNK
jgi:hypothetical protein